MTTNVKGMTLLLLLSALDAYLISGCMKLPSGPDATPALTQNQEYMEQQTMRWAEVAGVKVAVFFAPGSEAPNAWSSTTGGTVPAFGWVPFQKDDPPISIGYNVEAVEKKYVRLPWGEYPTYGEYAAAHEVCHVVHKDHTMGRVGWATKEQEADECAHRMLRGERP